MTTFLPDHYRDLINMVETGPAQTLTEAGALPPLEHGLAAAPGAQLPDQAAHQLSFTRQDTGLTSAGAGTAPR